MEEEEEDPKRGSDIKTLQEVFTVTENSLELLKKHDPNPPRSGTVAHSVEQSSDISRNL